MRIAFEVFGGSSWTGGINYLVNLLSAIDELPGKPIQPILFSSPKTDQTTLDRLTPYLSEAPILTDYWTKGTLACRYRFFNTLLTKHDSVALQLFQKARIDVTFVHAGLEVASPSRHSFGSATFNIVSFLKCSVD